MDSFTPKEWFDYYATLRDDELDEMARARNVDPVWSHLAQRLRIHGIHEAAFGHETLPIARLHALKK